MKKLCLALAILAAGGGSASAASAFNSDAEARTLVVTEGGSQSAISIPPGATVEFCANGCFIMMPDGVRDTLTGMETIEIIGGEGRIR